MGAGVWKLNIREEIAVTYSFFYCLVVDGAIHTEQRRAATV